MEDILDVNAISKELSKISIGSLALDKLLSGVFALVVCLLCIWLLMKLTDKALANSKRLDGALRGFIRAVVKAATAKNSKPVFVEIQKSAGSD